MAIKCAHHTRFNQGPVVQSVVSLTSSLRVILLTVLADSIYNILIFFAEKMWVLCTAKATHIFFSKKFQHICVSLDVSFNESLTNDIVSLEQLGPDIQMPKKACSMLTWQTHTHVTDKATVVIKCVRRSDLECDNIEWLWLEILLKSSKTFLVGIIYRHPHETYSGMNCSRISLIRYWSVKKKYTWWEI